MKKVVILGAGISGLSLGFFLKKNWQMNLDQDLQLIIIEKNSMSGGWVKTIEKEGFLFDLGPRSCRTVGNGLATLQLIEELGIEEEMIFADSHAKNRFIYLNKKMEKLPTGFFSFFTSSFRRGLLKEFLKAFFKNMKSSKKMEGDESIESFVSRKLTPKIARELVDPFISGIFAGHISKLSLKSTFPKVYALEKSGKSIFRLFFSNQEKKQQLSSFIKKIQKKKIFSFKKGMQTLTDALEKKLESHLLLSSSVKRINILDEKVEIELDKSEFIEADYLFSTLSFKDLSELISSSPLTAHLNSFSSTSVAVVSLGYKTQVIKERGFGYLIPSHEKESLLGVVFDSSVFKEQNRSLNETRLTVMIGGEHFKNFENYKREDFIEIALNGLSKHLNISDKPEVTHVELAKDAIPQYLVGYEKRVADLNFLIPPHIKLLGSSLSGVSVNDCIAFSKSIADENSLLINLNSIAKKSQQEQN